MKRAPIHAALLPMNYETLIELLRLPQGAVIHRVQDDQGKRGIALLTVEHPGLPLYHEGCSRR